MTAFLNRVWPRESGHTPSGDEVNNFDLAFVVDTTGSMGGLIANAQRDMLRTIEEVAGTNVSLRVGLVEYRDHPPQDTLVFRAHDFASHLPSVQKTINALRAQGGGDGPEAVLDGVVATARTLNWRPHARRVAVLIGDAPPHGLGEPGDGFRHGCPCGETVESATAQLEEARITLYAIGLTTQVTSSFTQLSSFTGGEYFAAIGRRGHDGAGAAIAAIKALLAEEFGALEADRRVLEAVRESTTLPLLDELATHLDTSRPAVAASLSRLGSRGLLSS